MNPWLLLGVAVALAAAYFAGMKQGKQIERSVWQEKELIQSVQYTNKIQELNDRNRKQEADHAKALDDIATDRERDRIANEARRARDVAAARDGSLKLLVSADACKARRSAAPEASASPAIGDDSATIELPRAITESLLDIANDADSVADQLRSCQAVILSDRREINAEH